MWVWAFSMSEIWGTLQQQLQLTLIFWKTTPFSIFNSVEVMGQMTAMIRSMEASLDRVERIKGEKNIDDGGGDISLKSYDIVCKYCSNLSLSK